MLFILKNHRTPPSFLGYLVRAKDDIRQSNESTQACLTTFFQNSIEILSDLITLNFHMHLTRKTLHPPPPLHTYSAQKLDYSQSALDHPTQGPRLPLFPRVSLCVISL